MIEKLLAVKTLDDLGKFTHKSESLKLGIEELRGFHTYFDIKQPHNTVQFDITLARGLNYYTGCIFEVQATDVKMGSIGGGGRYDDLTGVFGLKDVSGVGISFGADRIYDCLEELKLFPEKSDTSLQVFFVAFDDTTHRFAFNILTQLRGDGINADIYPEPNAKIKKQFDYANRLNVPYVAVVGSEEMNENCVALKNMTTGAQEKIKIPALVTFLTKI